MGIWVKAARVGFALALGLTLFYAFKPPTGEGGGLFPWDKADHFSAFFTLAVLAIAAFPRTSLLRIGIALSVLGAMIEVIQALPFVHRDGDVFDWVAEMCALTAVFGTLISARIRRTAASED